MCIYLWICFAAWTSPKEPAGEMRGPKPSGDPRCLYFNKAVTCGHFQAKAILWIQSGKINLHQEKKIKLEKMQLNRALLLQVKVIEMWTGRVNRKKTVVKFQRKDKESLIPKCLSGTCPHMVQVWIWTCKLFAMAQNSFAYRLWSSRETGPKGVFYLSV